MKVKVQYFAQVAEKVGFSSEEVELSEGSNSQDLINVLQEKHPEIEALTYSIAVDHKLIRTVVDLKHHVEVALLPPFAGG